MGYSPDAFGSMTADQPSDYSAARAEARPTNTTAVQACYTCKVLSDRQFEVAENALRQKNQSYPKSQYAPSSFDYRWKKDLGGTRYTWPAVTGLPAEDSPDKKGMMGNMSETTARRQPFISTVAYAVIEVLRVNGRTVTSMTAHS